MKKIVLAVLTSLIGVIFGLTYDHFFISNKKNNFTKEMKYREYYNILNKWLQLKQDGINIEKYFINNNIRQIAIYGMGELGLHLYEELKNTSIEVKYGIDKEGDKLYSMIDTYTMYDELEKVDAIIVTAVFDYNSIVSKLNKKVSYPIISLDDVVFNLE